MTRQQSKQILRRMGELGTEAILGQKIPRRYRRFAGRVYANAAFRKMWSLPDTNPQHRKHKAHPAVVAAIVREFDKVDQNG